MAKNAVAHPDSIAQSIEAIWYSGSGSLEVSIVHTDEIILEVAGVKTRTEARDVLNQALGALGPHVILSE